MNGIVSAADATIIVALTTSVFGPVALYLLHRRAEQARAVLRDEFKQVRQENIDQHANGQRLLQTLVDSHHHLGDKVDNLADKVDRHIADHDGHRSGVARTRATDRGAA